MDYRGGRVFLLFTLLLAYLLRAWRLDFQELRGDEAFGYFFSLRPYAEIIETTLALEEPHPVGSYFVQHAWLQWAGHSEFSLRFVSMWWGVLAVALIYRLGRRLSLDRITAGGAAALLAASPYAIWHGQDARMYSMSLVLTLASTWLAVEWWQRQRWPWAAACVAISWLALHTHYFNIFVLLAQSVFVFSRALFLPRLRHTAVGWMQLQVMLGLLYLPWLIQASGILSSYGGNGDSPGLWEMLYRSTSVFAVGESTPAAQRTTWAAVAGILFLTGVARLARNGGAARRSLWLLLLCCFGPLLATWFSALERPIFNERYLLVAVPSFYLLLAAGVCWVFSFWSSVLRNSARSGSIGPRRVQAILSFGHLVITLVFISGVGLSLQRHYADPAYSKTRGWRRLAEAFERYTAQFPQDHVRLAQNYPDPTIWYYYDGPVAHVVLPPAAQDRAGATEVVAELAAADVQRVVLAMQPAANWDDENIAERALAEHYHLVAKHQAGVWPLWIYALPPRQNEPVAVRFQNGVQLANVSVQPGLLGPGDILEVYLTWRGDAQELSGTEKVFVQLLSEDGVLVAQDDRPLDRATLGSALDAPASYAILLPDPLPAGTYYLITGLYDPAQPGAPRVRTMGNVDFLEIGSLTTGQHVK